MTDLTHASASDLGRALRARRKSLGLTRDALATRLGVSPSLITRMETAKVVIEVTRFRDWCASLGLRLDVTEAAIVPTIAEMSVVGGEDDGA